MTTLRSVPNLTGVEVDLTASTIILFSNQTQQPLSTTQVASLEVQLGLTYPHLLDSNTCNVVVINNQTPA